MKWVKTISTLIDLIFILPHYILWYHVVTYNKNIKYLYLFGYI